MSTPLPPEFAKPEGLSPLGEAAYETITKFLAAQELTYTGGHTKVFYTPAEWAERKEKYGLTSELIIVHDGGDHGEAFSYDKENYVAIDLMNTALGHLGLHAEQCTIWYTAIYKD